MATTRIIPMHLNKGKTLAQCLADRTEYGMNPDKTEGGALISSGGSSLVSTFLSFGILLGISSMNAEDEARDIDRLELREEVGA